MFFDKTPKPGMPEVVSRLKEYHLYLFYPLLAPFLHYHYEM